MKKFYTLIFTSLFALAGATQAATMVTTVTFDSGVEFLRDASGTLLSAGTSADGDGAVLQLGYYDGATVGNNFLGNWIPLSGEGSLNTGLISGTSITFDSTSIGDLNAAAGENGTFAIELKFTVGDSQTGNNLPSSTSIPLSIRFFNGTTLAGSTRFNVVSSDTWIWQTPGGGVTPPTVNITLSDPNLEWQGGASSAFKTTLPVPEPSTGLALLGGVALLVAHRRRR